MSTSVPRRNTADRVRDYAEGGRHGLSGAFERRPVMFAEPEEIEPPLSPSDHRAGYKGYFTPSRTRTRTRTRTGSGFDTEESPRPAPRRRFANSSAEGSSDESRSDFRNCPSRGRSTRTRMIPSEPYRRGYSDDSTDDGYDPDLGGIVYSFVPSRSSPAGSAGSEISSNSHDLTAADRSLGQESSLMMRLGSPKNAETLHISTSRYTGEPYLVGARSAELKVVRETKQPRQSLFRWVHLSQKTLNFDELSTEVMQIPGLSASERHDFDKLLTQVKKDAIRPRQLRRDKTVQHMEPGSIRLTIPVDQQPRSKGLKATRVLTWLCIPYFTLEEYSGLGAEVSNAGFPIETLLQHEIVRTPRSRDERYQIVRQNGYGKNGECLHISQLWCIVLDNSLLITCGRMPAPSLRGEIISLKDAEPPTDPSRKPRTIFVSYYKAAMWALPLDSCLSWFSFLKHFREFWPRAIAFYDHRGNVISQNEWPRVVNETRRANTKVILDLRLRSHSLPRETGVLRGLASGAAENTGEENRKQTEEKESSMPAQVNDTFHVFTWLGDTRPSSVSSSAGIDTELVVKQLQEIETYILRSTGTRDRSAYSRCGTSSCRAVHDYLAVHTMETEHSGVRMKKQHDTRVNLYNAADLVFRFFLPWTVDSQAPTVGKFWGALQSLVEMPIIPKKTEGTSRASRKTHYSPRQTITNICSALRVMARYMQSFQDIFSQISADERRHVTVPDTMVQAWLHLVIGLIHGSQGDLSWEEYLNVADGLVRKGMSETMLDLEAPDLLDSTVVQPLDLVSLLVFQLLTDSTDGHVNLSDTYQNHLMGLKEDIDEKPNRSHQLGLSRLQEEVAIIRRIISSQKRIVITLRPALAEVANDNSKEARILDREKRMKVLQVEKDRREQTEMSRLAYDKREAYACDKRETYPEDYRDPELYVGFDSSQGIGAFSKLSPTDIGGITELFGSDSWNWLLRKDLEFQEIQLEAERLDQQNINMIDTTKDRQEAAVFAFTMVTIVFLPLGTISSIFGMNTRDIANMELGQWVYWATALPTTSLVIVLGLWWMGELENLFEKLPSWFPYRPSGTRSRYSAENATIPVYRDREFGASLEERPRPRSPSSLFFRPRSPTGYRSYR